MLTPVLNDRFAPTTGAIGFVKAPVADVVAAYQLWDKKLEHETVMSQFEQGLTDSIWALEPLSLGGFIKTLFVGTQGGEWTAIVDNAAQGGDPSSAVYVMAADLDTTGVLARYSPNVYPGGEFQEQMGGVQLVIRLPNPEVGQKQLHRSVSVSRQGARRWEFHQNGQALPFEDTEAYTKRRIIDRFTAQMMQEYCLALGIDIFNDDFYVGPSYVAERVNAPWIQRAEKFTYAQARERLGLVPFDPRA